MSDLAPLLSVEDVARLLNISRAKVYELIRRRDLPSVKFSKFRRIEPAALVSFIEHHRDTGHAPHDREAGPMQAARQGGKKA